jgi:uncharacterized protein
MGVQMLRVLAFTAGLAAVYAVALVLLIRLGLRWNRRRRGVALAGRSWIGIWFERVVLGTAGVGVLCIGWGYWIEPTWLEVTRIRLENAKIPAGAKPIRVAHLSDHQSEDVLRLEREIVDRVREAKPDLIVFCGDCVNDASGLPYFRESMNGLAEIAPLFGVRGNWEVHNLPHLRPYEETKVRVLRGETATINVRGTPVWIGGASFGDDDEHERALSQVPAEAVSIFVTHTPDDVVGDNPDEFRSFSPNTVDLCCAGHTHGGQVALPFYGALITFSRFDKRFERGLHRLGDTWLYVNRGLGLDGYKFPRVRFLARPELTLFDLTPPGPLVEE